MNQPWVHMCLPILNALPSPSPSHPSGLSQSTSFECPVSCMEIALVIFFTYVNIHVSVLFSQIIPPLPSPTPVLLPRKFHGWRSLVGYSPWSHKESDTTERLHFTHFALSQSPKVCSLHLSLLLSHI